MSTTRQFRDTMGLFATGVAVVAVHDGSEVHAMTANAVSSLSLEPMLLLFCPARKARLSPYLKVGVPFSINLLRAEQQAISTYFAGTWTQNAPPPFRFVPMGQAPRLEGSLASIGCTVRSIGDGGDHLLVVGEVLQLKQGIAPHLPLLFYRGRYGGLEPGSATVAPDLAAVTDEPTHIYYDPHA
jgi:flavin reductase (DIM6/NTAB) family NADH-FMN oxidoreductase RutF